MYIIYLDSLHPKNKKHKVNKVSFLHSQTTKRKSSGSAITSQGNRGRCRRTKWFPCHHGRRPIAQINLNRKKKKKKRKPFQFSSFSLVLSTQIIASLLLCLEFFSEISSIHFSTQIPPPLSIPFLDFLLAPSPCLLFLSLLFLLTLFIIIININSLSLSLCSLVGSMLLAEEFCCRRHTARQG